MRTTTLVVDLIRRTIVLNGNKPMPLSPQYFALYTFLAVGRKRDSLHTGGFLNCDAFLSLPEWMDNTVASVGKQISRHLKQNQVAASLIEAQQLTKGPYRLRVSPHNIHFQPHVNAAESFLHSNAGDSSDVSLTLVNSITKGNHAFDDGDITAALAYYRDALVSATRPLDQVFVMQKIGRAQERQGLFEEALATHIETSGLLKTVRPAVRYAEAATLVLTAWVHYKQAELLVKSYKKDSGDTSTRPPDDTWRRTAAFHMKTATRLYDNAFALVSTTGHNRIIGDIYNGRAELYRLNNDLDRAEQYYRRALDAWLLADYTYGIQAIYSNLASLLLARAEDVPRQPHPQNAQDAYLASALSLAQSCLSICSKFGIGDDHAETELLLCDIYLRLGDKATALGIAQQTLRHAYELNNQYIVQRCAATISRLNSI